LSDDLTMLRAALAARRDGCLDRLDDAVSELCSLHEVDGEVIVDRVRGLIADERPHEAHAVADKA
jgi:hypothetical protein